MTRAETEDEAHTVCRAGVPGPGHRGHHLPRGGHRPEERGPVQGGTGQVTQDWCEGPAVSEPGRERQQQLHSALPPRPQLHISRHFRPGPGRAVAASELAGGRSGGWC